LSRRSRIVGFGSAALLVVAGAACAAIFAGSLGQILALVLISLGFVEAVSLVFLEVGFSEDRERAAAHRRRASGRASGQPRSGPPTPKDPPNRSRPVRLDRMRGRPRRLR
jgi:hypothetical protein